MNYREYGPAPELAPLVRCLWTLEGHAAELGGELQPVLPDGRPEIVMHFGDPFERMADGRRVERQPALLYAGQITRQIVLRPTGRIAVVGVRLHSHGAASLIDAPQHELRGLTIDLDHVARRLSRSLNELFDAGLPLDAAVDAIQRRLAASLRPAHVPPHVGYAVGAIYRHDGCLSIDALARRSGVTRRHLERQFKALVGVSPKRLARIVRFQRAVQTLESGDAGAATAARCGYADQAHFSRDYREFCGYPPGDHILRRAELTGLFLEKEERRGR